MKNAVKPNNCFNLIGKSVLLILLLSFSILSYSNPTNPKLRQAIFRISNANYIPINGIQTSNTKFNSFLSLNHVSSYYKIYPNKVLTEVLGDLFFMETSDTMGFPKGGIDSFSSLEGVDEIFFISNNVRELCNNPVAFNDPNKDQNGNSFSTNNTWALDAVDAPCGWNFTTGANSVSNPPMLAIIEGVVDRTHDELSGRVLNSFIPSGTGLNYLTSAQGDHGTSVAGSALAATNNNIGVASVGHSIKCNHFEYFSFSPGEPHPYSAFLAILDAIDKGSKIINCSFTNIFDNTTYYGTNFNATTFLTEMVNKKSVTFVMAAGNSNGDPSNLIKEGKYEFTKNIPGVIVVGGINKDYKCQFSSNDRFSIGTHLDLCAPAKDIISLKRSNDPNDNSQYQVVGGTSNAAPMVAATIALMLDLKPDLTPPEIECILKATTNPIADYGDFELNGESQVGTGRLSVFKALQYVNNLLAIKENLVDVTTSLTWSTNKFLDHDIFVKNGGILTINNSTIKFATGKKLIVEQGGKLVVSNSILTNSFECAAQSNFIYKMWGGVVIRSHGNGIPQSTSTSGYVILNSNSTISNAHVGCTMGEWNIIGDNAGGVLNASDSKIQNCRFGVIMGTYINPNNPDANITKFNNVDFINDIKLVEYNYDGGNTQAWLSNVKGIRFSGCKFLNTIPASGLRGIGAWDCKIFVSNGYSGVISGTCPNMPLGRNSEFNNLGIGIQSLGSNIDFNRLQNVGSLFKNCKHGIWMGTDLLSEIIDCDFNIDNDFTFPATDPNNPNTPNFHHIYSNESKGFSIADSRFNFGITKFGYGDLFAIKTYKANEGISGINTFTSEVAKCRFDRTVSSYKIIGQMFWDINWEFYMYCNYYSGNLTRSWAGFDGSYLNSQSGNKKSTYQIPPLANLKTWPNNIFDICVNTNRSIEGVTSKLFNIVKNPTNGLTGPFSYFVEGAPGSGIPLNPIKYPGAGCRISATIPFATNTWVNQCDYNNPSPWFNMVDVFCRNTSYPLIPLRNAVTVTGQTVLTGPSINNEKSNSEKINPNYDYLNLSNDSTTEVKHSNRFNSFMVKYYISNSDLQSRDLKVRNLIFQNINSYTTQEKIAAYEILIHWYDEDVNNVHRLFGEIKENESNSTNVKEELIGEKESDQFAIYPSPSIDGLFNIKSSVEIDHIDIYSSNGSLVKSIVVSDFTSIQQFQLEAQGLYLIRLFKGQIFVGYTQIIVLNR